MMNPGLKRNNLKALAFLAGPLILAGLSIYLFTLNSLIWYCAGNSVAFGFLCPNLYSVT